MVNCFSYSKARLSKERAAFFTVLLRSMGSIGNKLLLLVKGGLHRLGGPSGQEKDWNKDQENARESNIKADPQQPQRHGFFSGFDIWILSGVSRAFMPSAVSRMA